jgi:hypothetical protein
MAHLGFQAQPTTTPKITAIHSGAMKVTRFPKMSITTTVELRNMMFLGCCWKRENWNQRWINMKDDDDDDEMSQREKRYGFCVIEYPIGN